MTYLQSLAVTVIVLALSHMCRPCKVANWEPMTVAEQAAEAEIIVHGTVIAHYAMPDVPIDRVGLIICMFSSTY